MLVSLAPSPTDLPAPAVAANEAGAAQQLSDFALLNACRRRDPDAWQNIYERYSRLVFSVVLRCGLTAEDAADVTQITFTVLLDSLDHLRDDSNLGAWLCTVARRHAWRMRKRDTLVDGFDDASDEFLHDARLVVGTASGNELSYWETAHWINDGLAQLGERCRSLLLALYFDSSRPSYTDIAAKLEMPVGSIGPIRARCLLKLKMHLKTD
jgi:RNA polymerase sigma factor (sigma-70 family)